MIKKTIISMTGELYFSEIGKCLIITNFSLIEKINIIWGK